MPGAFDGHDPHQRLGAGNVRDLRARANHGLESRLGQLHDGLGPLDPRRCDLEVEIVGDGFVDQGAMEELAPESRAGLLMATRRFDDAIDTLEKLLSDPDEHPALLIAPLTDYLVLNLQVKDDFLV